MIHVNIDSRILSFEIRAKYTLILIRTSQLAQDGTRVEPHGAACNVQVFLLTNPNEYENEIQFSGAVPVKMSENFDGEIIKEGEQADPRNNMCHAPQTLCTLLPTCNRVKNSALPISKENGNVYYIY